MNSIVETLICAWHCPVAQDGRSAHAIIGNAVGVEGIATQVITYSSARSVDDVGELHAVLRHDKHIHTLNVFVALDAVLRVVVVGHALIGDNDIGDFVLLLVVFRAHGVEDAMLHEIGRASCRERV